MDALLLREDNRFYDHGGVDWIGVGRAFMQCSSTKSTQGASLTSSLLKLHITPSTTCIPATEVAGGIEAAPRRTN
ncbi:MAG: transglycosylase domain-containing protein [Akkermansia muciniphila]